MARCPEYGLFAGWCGCSLSTYSFLRVGAVSIEPVLCGTDPRIEETTTNTSVSVSTSLFSLLSAQHAITSEMSHVRALNVLG